MRRTVAVSSTDTGWMPLLDRLRAKSARRLDPQVVDALAALAA
jgi:hypothetical protein